MKQRQWWQWTVLCGCQPTSCSAAGPQDAALSSVKVASQQTQVDRIRRWEAVHHAAMAAMCSQQQSPAEIQAPTCADNSHGRKWTSSDDCLSTLPVTESWTRRRNSDFCSTDIRYYGCKINCISFPRHKKKINYEKVLKLSMVC